METLPRRVFLDEAQGAVYMACAMVVFENIEPEPESTKIVEHLVNECSQGFPTETISRLGNHDPLQFDRAVGRGQPAKNDVTGRFVSFFHSVISEVRVAHMLLVDTNIVIVNKTELGEALLSLKKKRKIVWSGAAQLHCISNRAYLPYPSL